MSNSRSNLIIKKPIFAKKTRNYNDDIKLDSFFFKNSNNFNQKFGIVKYSYFEKAYNFQNFDKPSVLNVKNSFFYLEKFPKGPILVSKTMSNEKNNVVFCFIRGNIVSLENIHLFPYNMNNLFIFSFKNILFLKMFLNILLFGAKNYYNLKKNS